MREPAHVITFAIAGPPRGKQRARTGKGFAFTPAKTVMYENYVKMQWNLAAPRKWIPWVGPVAIQIVAGFPIAPSWPRWRRDAALAGVLLPLSTPDYDNIEKIITDALNGIAFHDDAQIVHAQIDTRYSDAPKTVVVLEFYDALTRKMWEEMKRDNTVV